MDAPNDTTTTTSGEATPGHSQKHFTASETVNLTQEKCEAHTNGTTGNTMMQKSLLWAPC